MSTGMGPIDLLKEFLDSHASPSIIVERKESNPENIAPNTPSLMYANPSFTAWIGDSTLSEETFREWVEDPLIWDGLEHGKTVSIPYARLMWVASLVGGKRWGLLQSQTRYEQLLTPESEESYRPHKRPRTLSNAGRASVPAFASVHYVQARVLSTPVLEDRVSRILDWTRYDIPNATEFIKWLRSFDWSRTKIGPMNDWSPIVRQTMVSIVTNPAARCVYFGLEDPIMLYNEACSKLLGHRHPSAMGAEGAVGAGEHWPPKYAQIKEVWDAGIAKEHYDFYHPIPRGDLALEEAHFSWSITPIVDNCGRMVGVQKEFSETTDRVLAKRRGETLKMAEGMTVLGATLNDYWTNIQEVLHSNCEDFPFCLMYSAPQDQQPEKVGDASIEDLVPRFVKLEGLVGLAYDHPMAIERYDLRSLEFLLAKHFRTAWITRQPITLSDKDRTLPERLQSVFKGRGWDSPCRSAMLYPIKRLDGPSSVGFLLFGLNPQRQYDNEYRRFITGLMDKFEKAAAGIVVPEEREKLKQQWQKAKDQERVFTRLSEFASVGLAIFTPHGEQKKDVKEDAKEDLKEDVKWDMNWKNPTFKELTNLQGNGPSYRNYQLPIHPQDRQNWENAFAQLVRNKNPNRKPYFHCRFQIDLSIPEEEAVGIPEIWRWLYAHASGEFDDLNDLKWVGLYVTDVTHQQKEIQQQGQRLVDALETKRQSENFIDMTCHEMRNPLSAIIQSVDGILDLQPLPKEVSARSHIKSDQSELQASILDYAQTILLCAQHQKRIVDDILTLSKLDSNLLLIAPDRVRPTTLVKRALSMYDGELAEAGITASFIVEESYSELNIDRVLLDPARLLQILINLLTNAIKFTKKEASKRISVHLGASLTPPSAGAATSSTVSFIPRRASRIDVLSAPEWGSGEVIYLSFDVCDTGKGLTTEEMKRLFQRFHQASAKTFSQYGGSGLGLFISRELTELQGGQIGVDSVAGHGSAFAFYVKARRCSPEPPENRVLSDAPSDEALPAVQPVKASPTASLTYADAAVPVPLLEPKTHRPTATAPQVPSDLHILLVEDNLLNQRVTAQQLRRVGCTVHVANHGVECLEFLEKTSFWHNAEGASEEYGLVTPAPQIPLSVILLDQEMPVMDGLTCVGRIRQMQQDGELTGHIPVIACTGNARREQVSGALEAGMDEVVTKPFRIGELLPKMYELISRVRNRPVPPRRIPTEPMSSHPSMKPEVSMESIDTPASEATPTSSSTI